MNTDVIKTLIVIALRHLAPLLGGAGLISDNELAELAGGIILLGSIAYHAYQRSKGKQETIKVGAVSLLSNFDSASGQPGPIAESAKRHAEAIAKVQATKPASFTVGAYTDGEKVTAEATVQRKWSNGWGLTAYARAWWNDAPVTPNPKKFGGEAGFEGEYKFGGGGS